MNTIFGIDVPETWEQVKFVETVDGCFTLQANVSPYTDKGKADIELLQIKAREILCKLTGQDKIERYQKQ